jgi:hypothetical protein
VVGAARVLPRDNSRARRHLVTRRRRFAHALALEGEAVSPMLSCQVGPCWLGEVGGELAAATSLRLSLSSS